MFLISIASHIIAESLHVSSMLVFMSINATAFETLQI